MTQLPKTSHLDLLTDNFGVWQHHENGEILRSEGYALDDSARALIVYLLYSNKEKAEICLQYLEKSCKDGQMVGFFWEDKSIRKFPSSEDAFALAFWALAFCVHHNFEKERAQAILDKLDFTVLYNSHYIRTESYTLIALSLLGKKEDATKIFEKIMSNYSAEKKWFEDKLTYGNAIIPYSLLTYCESFNITAPETKEIITNAINTLERYCRIGVIPVPVGNHIWQEIGKPERDPYGQQPIDPAFMVLLHTKAYRYFKEKSYLEKAKDWIGWFHGNNIMKQSLINENYACGDGIDENWVSDHYGAESTIVYLWAEYEYHLAADKL